MAMKTPREHIEEIRRMKFLIGGERNPVMEDLHQALKYLSAELYSDAVHFLVELIQNAEDNEYPADVEPSLEFVITSKDITATGVSATLLVFNNEKGFTQNNIDSICSIGRSTKKGNRQCGYIGEKGIGFKSVFLVTSQPYIFSNSYQIRFNEEPPTDCNVGYVVPEWVEKPTLSDIHQIYGSDRSLPTTTIILPLKSAKVLAVKQQLSSIHPEVLLFLPKIKRLSVREDNEVPMLNTINAISISSETEFHTRKSIDAESYTLHLYCAEKESECSYHVWRQRFPVRAENRVERRMEVEEWVIALAFPYGQRQNTEMTLPDIYAFLPTQMVSNFPFIIQADFILTLSRETIVFDNKWNKGILDCVPSAFASAFASIVSAVKSAPLSSLLNIFKFLPLNNSSYPVLNDVRNATKLKLLTEPIIPFESSMQEKIFRKPDEVVSLMPAFWDILLEAEMQGFLSQFSSSCGRYILNSTCDDAKYDAVFKFLGVEPAGAEWYVECIGSSNLVLIVSEDVYMELLCFIAENWDSQFANTNINRIHLLKYVDAYGRVTLQSIDWATQFYSPRICYSSNTDHVSWLSAWNLEFRCAEGPYFMPNSTQDALESFPKSSTIREWLRKNASVEGLTVHDYAVIRADALGNDRRLLIPFTHFLYHSLKRNFLSEIEVSQLCDSMPLVDSRGYVIKQRRALLVPANGSKWAGLLGSNPWIQENYIELGDDYLRAGHFAGLHSSEKELMKFLATHMKPSDIPDLFPPDASFHTVSSPLRKENAFLLLDWIRHLKYNTVEMPGNFLRCIREGSWLKTLDGYRPPSESLFYSTEWENLEQKGFSIGAIPFIDEEFYDYKISHYTEELKIIDVIFEYGKACEYIAKHLTILAASSRLTPSKMLLMLNFVRYLSEGMMSPEDFISSIKRGHWLKTTADGHRSPVGSVLFDHEWKLASEISSPPFVDINYYFVDINYYGEEILSYQKELQLMGVVVGFNQNYQLVADHFRLPSSFASVTADGVLLMLECIRCCSRSSRQIIAELKIKRWLRTNLGYKLPAESFLFNHEWGCLLKIFRGIPLIDEKYYGSGIRTYMSELKEVGVAVTFQEASKAVTQRFKELISSYSVKRNNVVSLFDCYRHLKGTDYKFPSELEACIFEERWLWTRLGYRSPKESILLDAEWEAISPIVSLPFIDDIDGFYDSRIYEYRDELKYFGAVLEFREGSALIARGLNIRNPSDVTPATALSLLKCVRSILELDGSLPDGFMERVNVKWMKTLIGFRSPSESILFDSNWESLRRKDVPFVDEEFYGAEISSYRSELKAIGVIVEFEHGCSLLAGDRGQHSYFTKRLGVLKAQVLKLVAGNSKAHGVESQGCSNLSF